MKTKSITFRPSSPVASMLARIRLENRVVSKVINDILQTELAKRGYARKRELAK